MKVVYMTLKDQLDAAIIDAISSKRNIVRFEMTQEECDVLEKEWRLYPNTTGEHSYKGIPISIVDQFPASTSLSGK